MNFSGFRVRWRVSAVSLLTLLLALPAPSHAQLSGQPIVNLGNLGTPVQGMDSGYDPARGVFLVVSAYINAHGWFVNGAGQIVAGPFLIKAGGGGSFAPRVRYSPQANSGQGAFLVIYAEEGPSNQNILHARVVSFPGIVGPETTLSEGSAWPWIISGSSAVGYSPSSGVFMVAWMTTGPGLPLVGRIVGLTGAPAGPVLRLSNDVGIYPGVTWNSHTNRFGVSFRDEGSFGYSGFAIVSPASSIDALQRFQPVAGQQGATDIDFNPDTGRYIMTWFAQPAGGPWEARAAEMDSFANVLSSGLVYSKSGGIGFSSLSLAFNPISRTFLGATMETNASGLDPVVGFELNRYGVRTSAMTAIGPGVLARNVRVSTSTVSPTWNVAFNHNTQSAVNFIAGTTSTGGGPAGQTGSGGGTPTPPPPPPPTSSCTSPQPASDWVCVNGNWLPPGMVSPAPAPAPAPAPPPPSSSCTSPQPASDWVCVNGDWLPPSLAPASALPPPPPPSSTCTSVQPAYDWVCVNGNWLPPSLAPAPAPTSSCTTVQPGSDWVCVNGDWIPLAMSCPTVQPGPGWTCRNGDWFPPGMVLNLRLDPTGFDLPGVVRARATAIAYRSQVVRRSTPGRG